MMTQTSLYLTILLLTSFILINSISATPIHVNKQEQKRSFAALLGRLGFGSEYLLPDRTYRGANIGSSPASHKNQDMRKKWARFFQEPQSPYAIAFPALIRSR
jgi:hypothetical protein